MGHMCLSYYFFRLAVRHGDDFQSICFQMPIVLYVLDAS